MHPRVLDLLQRQERDGFPDLGGTEVAATIPCSDRLINELIAGLLPADGKVREVEIQAKDNNLIGVKVRLSASFLPAISLTVAIEDQPDLPARPVLGLRVAQPFGILAKAASVLPTLVTLPPGVSIDGDRITIDIRRLLAERQLDHVLEYVADLHVNTRAGAVVVDLRARINPR